MTEPVRRSALEGHLEPGRHGAPDGARVRLSQGRVEGVTQLQGIGDGAAAGQALAALGFTGEPAAGRAIGGADLRLLWNGPGQYLAVSSRRHEQQLSAALNEALAGTGACAVDVSHARTLLRLAGPASRDLLAKGCPLDLDVMASGDCAPTVVSHFNVLLHCDGEDAFELWVTRSFAQSFLEWLLHAGAEYGVQVTA